jgi:hypothetical protein
MLLRTAQTSTVEPPFHQTKFTIHKTWIHPVLFCGSKKWMLTKREEKQFFEFKMRVFRTICGPKIENGVYRRRDDHELDKEFNNLNVTKTSRLRYAGH